MHTPLFWPCRLALVQPPTNGRTSSGSLEFCVLALCLPRVTMPRAFVLGARVIRRIEPPAANTTRACPWSAPHTCWAPPDALRAGSWAQGHRDYSVVLTRTRPAHRPGPASVPRSVLRPGGVHRSSRPRSPQRPTAADHKCTAWGSPHMHGPLWAVPHVRPQGLQGPRRSSLRPPPSRDPVIRASMHDTPAHLLCSAAPVPSPRCVPLSPPLEEAPAPPQPAPWHAGLHMVGTPSGPGQHVSTHDWSPLSISSRQQVMARGG